MRRRLLRVNDLLKREISDLVARQLKDPRLASMVTVTDVETSQELRHARVFVSVMGTQEEKDAALLGLRSATRFLRHELGERLDLKRVPDLTFAPDESLERGARILAILDHVAAEGGGQ